jgi:hypothetical protein
MSRAQADVAATAKKFLGINAEKQKKQASFSAFEFICVNLRNLRKKGFRTYSIRRCHRWTQKDLKQLRLNPKSDSKTFLL